MTELQKIKSNGQLNNNENFKNIEDKVIDY